MKHRGLLVALAFIVAPSLAAAGFDLIYKCEVTPRPDSLSLVPARSTIEIDTELLRARIRDDLVAESGSEWQFLNGIEKRGDHFIFQYSLRVLRKRLARRSAGYNDKRKFSYRYRIKQQGGAFGLVVFPATGTATIIRAKGRCVLVDQG